MAQATKVLPECRAIEDPFKNQITEAHHQRKDMHRPNFLGYKIQGIAKQDCAITSSFPNTGILSSCAAVQCLSRSSLTP
jgi:hypothetical protein